MRAVLMWDHLLRHRPHIKQHMAAGRVAHGNVSDTDHHIPPDTCVRVELMVSQRRRQRANIKKTYVEKLMNIQYLNLPPYPNRWTVWLIQPGFAWRPRCVKTCCKEDDKLARCCLKIVSNEFSYWWWQPTWRVTLFYINQETKVFFYLISS